MRDTNINRNWRRDKKRIMEAARHLSPHALAMYARSVIKGVDYAGTAKGTTAQALAGGDRLTDSPILKTVDEVISELGKLPCSYCKRNLDA